MSEGKTNFLIGLGALGIGIIWSGLSWWQDRKETQAQKRVDRLPDKHASPGYYWLEGMLDSSKPVKYDGRDYARLVCITTKGVQIPVEDQNYQILSNCESTTIQQVESAQVLTIEGVDVSGYLYDFPLTTICEESGNKIQVLPLKEGKYRITGYFDGNALRKVHNADHNVQSELCCTHQPQNPKNEYKINPFAWYLVIVGSVACIMNINKISLPKF